MKAKVVLRSVYFLKTTMIITLMEVVLYHVKNVYSFNFMTMASITYTSTMKMIQSQNIQPPANYHILILPGFFHTEKEYKHENHECNNKQNNNNNHHHHHSSLKDSLITKCGWKDNQIHTLPVSYLDWFQVFSLGLLDIRFWRGDASPFRPAFRWYLEMVKCEVEKIYYDYYNEESFTSGDSGRIDRLSSVVSRENESKKLKIILIGHSAGGKLMYVSLLLIQKANDQRVCNCTVAYDVRNEIIFSIFLGWLARAALGFIIDQDNMLQRQSYNEKKLGRSSQCLTGLIALGSPHISPEPGHMDITR